MKTSWFFQTMIGNPIETIEIPEGQNVWGTTAVFKNAPHKQAAKDFAEFLTTEKAASIYRKYGFEPLRK